MDLKSKTPQNVLLAALLRPMKLYGQWPDLALHIMNRA